MSSVVSTSKDLSKLVAYAKDLGVVVNFSFDFDYAGTVYYKEGHIDILMYTEENMVFALAHELGHYRHYLVCKDLPQPPMIIREAWACHYGYEILKDLNIEFDELAYMQFHSDISSHLGTMESNTGWEGEDDII